MNEDNVSALISQMRNARRLFGADWRLRSESASRLGELRSARAVPDLSEVIAEDQNFDLSLNAIRALGQIGGVQAARALEKIIDQPHHHQLQRAALAALQACGGLHATGVLLRHWAILSPAQKDATLWMLQCLEPHQIQALKPVLQANPDPVVQQMASRTGMATTSFLPSIGPNSRVR